MKRNSYFIKTETNIDGGQTITGISELSSVPYALYAKDASTVNGKTVETEVPENADFTDDQKAAEVKVDVVANSNLNASNVQEALEELQGAVDKAGDMKTSEYDTDENGVMVDNAATVNNLSVGTSVPADALFTDSQKGSDVNLATALDVNGKQKTTVESALIALNDLTKKLQDQIASKKRGLQAESSTIPKINRHGEHEIATLGNLLWLSKNSNMWGESFRQTKDINARKYVDKEGYQVFIPIGRPDRQFRGEFNGGGHKIENLHVDTDEPAGLFGYAKDATIENVHLVNCNISGMNNTGALIGNMESSILKRSSASGHVSVINSESDWTSDPYGNNYEPGSDKSKRVTAGGLVGFAGDNSEIIESCSSVLVQSWLWSRCG